VRELALAFQTGAFDAKANQELAALEGLIRGSLTHSEVGYLLEVSAYTDQFGQISIPSGQILYPVGVGTEPLDALAEYFRVPHLRAYFDPPAGMRDNSFFVWIARSGDALSARTVAPEFHRHVVDLGLAEARRRSLLASWTRALPQDPYRSIVRAEYWREVADSRASMIQDEQRRKDVLALTRRMEELQARANAVYREYQEVVRQLAQRNTFFEILAAVSAVSNVFRSAMELNALVSGPAGDIPVAGLDAPPATDLPRTMELTRQAIFTTDGQRIELEQRLTVFSEQLRDSDAILRVFYGDEKIPLPTKDDTGDPIPIPLPIP
jgi:hypothetical protein